MQQEKLKHDRKYVKTTPWHYGKALRSHSLYNIHCDIHIFIQILSTLKRDDERSNEKYIVNKNIKIDDKLIQSSKGKPTGLISVHLSGDYKLVQKKKNARVKKIPKPEPNVILQELDKGKKTDVTKAFKSIEKGDVEISYFESVSKRDLMLRSFRSVKTVMYKNRNVKKDHVQNVANTSKSGRKDYDVDLFEYESRPFISDSGIVTSSESMDITSEATLDIWDTENPLPSIPSISTSHQADFVQFISFCLPWKRKCLDQEDEISNEVKRVSFNYELHPVITDMWRVNDLKRLAKEIKRDYKKQQKLIIPCRTRPFKIIKKIGKRKDNDA